MKLAVVFGMAGKIEHIVVLDTHSSHIKFKSEYVRSIDSLYISCQSGSGHYIDLFGQSIFVSSYHIAERIIGKQAYLVLDFYKAWAHSVSIDNSHQGAVVPYQGELATMSQEAILNQSFLGSGEARRPIKRSIKAAQKNGTTLFSNCMMHNRRPKPASDLDSMLQMQPKCR